MRQFAGNGITYRQTYVPSRTLTLTKVAIQSSIWMIWSLNWSLVNIVFHSNQLLIGAFWLTLDPGHLGASVMSNIGVNLSTEMSPSCFANRAEISGNGAIID